MKSLSLVTLTIMLISLAGTLYAANLDDFEGAELDPMWTYRDPADKGEYTFDDSNLVLDLSAGADMWVAGTDAGVMFLTEPPADTNDFSAVALVNPAVDGDQPPACQIGIVFFNEAEWAYSAWGPYDAGTDIRLEDCVGADYRWRDDTQIGIDPGDVAIDQDVYLMVTKTGEELEFFAKGDANDDWVSGGVDTKLGPHYTPGNYQVGLIAKSWGGSVDSTFEFDYFNIPEIAAAVEPADKLSTTWGKIKKVR